MAGQNFTQNGPAPSGLTPQQIDEALKTMSAEQQDSYLMSMPEKDLDAYSRWAAVHNNSPKGPQEATSFTSPSGVKRQIVHGKPQPAPSRMPTEEEMAQMTDEQLEKLARGESISTDEVEKPKGWLDNKFGQTLRAGVMGAASLPLAIFDKVVEVPGVTGGSDATDAFMSMGDELGLGRPKTPGERVWSDVVSGTTGALATGGVGRFAPGAAGRLLGADLGKQALSGAIGGGAAGVVRENGGSADQQLAAGLLGGLSPQIIEGTIGNASRRLIRGGADGLDRMKQNIADFEQAGTFPSVGQATEGTRSREVEAFLSRLYGSSGRMHRFGSGQEDAIGSAITGKIDDLAPGGVNPTDVGNRFRTEVQENSLPGWRGMVDNKYRSLYREMPKDTTVLPGNFQRALQEEVATMPGARNLSTNQVLNRSRDGWVTVLQDLGKDIKANVTTGAGNGIPYEAVKQIRSKIGGLLERAAFDVDVDSASLKKLYGALSEDMKAAAAAAGPRAERAFAEANAAATKLHEHLDLIKPVLERNGGGEAVFQAMLSGTPEGATKLKAVFDSVKPDTRKFLAASIIQRMARSAPGTGLTQGDFSLQNFFKNYEALARSPEAMKQVFGRLPNGMSQDFEKIAKVAFNIRTGREEFGAATKAAEGRTGLQGILYPLLAAGGASVGLGSPKTAAGAAAGAGIVFGGSRYLANKMTDPKFVKWLAQTNSIPRSALPAAINQLAQQARRDHDDDLLAVTQELQQQTQQEDF